jgi:hypothetical protein
MTKVLYYEKSYPLQNLSIRFGCGSIITIMSGTMKPSGILLYEISIWGLKQRYLPEEHLRSPVQWKNVEQYRQNKIIIAGGLMLNYSIKSIA